MKRALIVLAIIAIGGVAPARAWCEAACVAPTEQGTPHCPSHEPADGITISAAGLDECPVLESARPSVPGRLELAGVAITGSAPAETMRTYLSPSFARLHSASTVFQRSIPLRL